MPWVLILLCLTGCNSLFYYPDRVMHGNPKKFGAQIQENLVEEHTISSGDEQLHLVRYVHKGNSCKGKVIQFHGNAQNLTAHAPLVAWLAVHGYDVIAFDYRGYGLSTGSPSQGGLVEDGRAVLTAASQMAPDCAKTFVIGQSLGGAVAVPAIALWKGQREGKGNVDGLIIDSSFPSYRRIARSKLAGNWVTWPLSWPLSFLVSDNLALKDFIGQVQSPILVIHSRRDAIIPFEFGREIFDSILAPCKLFWETNLGHIQTLGTPAYQSRLVEYLSSPERDCRRE